MKKEIISNIIDEAINKYHPTLNELKTKCSPSKSKTVIAGFQEQSAQHGLKFLTPDESGSAFTLYDEKNDTYLDFSNAFINKNIIDVKNNGDKYINLEDIFKGYEQLPTKVKKKIGLIKYHSYDEKEVGDGTEAWAKFIDEQSKTVGTITIPDYFFTKYNNKGKNGADNYEFVLAHEAMHNYDYKRPTKKTFDLLNRYFNGGYVEWQDRYKLFTNYIDATGKNKYTKTYGMFEKATQDNLDYLRNNNVNHDKSIRVNRSSDYGFSKKTEDFAEAGAMVMTGLHNPDNPNATVKYNNRIMQFREWVTIHPYQTQALAKELYGEKYSIDEILDLGESTPIVPTS